MERKRREAFNGTKPKRNARRRAADGSPPLLRPLHREARDERAVCKVERASSRGGRGDGQPVERSKPRVGHGVWRLSFLCERHAALGTFARRILHDFRVHTACVLNFGGSAAAGGRILLFATDEREARKCHGHQSQH